tara:strand:+ start:867 stop:1292 length:426 start_codon:yes stop_codon:yes gene_type:complete
MTIKSTGFLLQHVVQSRGKRNTNLASTTSEQKTVKALSSKRKVAKKSQKKQKEQKDAKPRTQQSSPSTPQPLTTKNARNKKTRKTGMQARPNPFGKSSANVVKKEIRKVSSTPNGVTSTTNGSKYRRSPTTNISHKKITIG